VQDGPRGPCREDPSFQESRVVVSDLKRVLDEIVSAIEEPPHDRDQLERTLTDGYAHALSLEAERFRIERRLTELAQGLRRGVTVGKAKELSSLAARLDDNAGDLSRLRAVLADLRRQTDSVRAGRR
jgi:hypothetical protein